MIQISYEEVKQIQLDILKYIDRFCCANHIRYSLAYGTLIGAIRHKGYIPWDDDIDIMMPRRDYNRFVKSFNGVYEHLSLLAPEINLNYYAPYANVFDNRTILTEGNNGHRGLDIGVKIDVFPIDNVSDDIRVYTKDMRKVDRINHIMYFKRLTNIFRSGLNLSWIIKVCIIKLLCSYMTYPYLQNKIKKIANNQMNYNSDVVDNVVFNIYSKIHTKFKKSILDSYIRVPFEDGEFYVVRDYDTVLRNIYGDYMQLPPVEKRIPHHNFEAYWID